MDIDLSLEDAIDLIVNKSFKFDRALTEDELSGLLNGVCQAFNFGEDDKNRIEVNVRTRIRVVVDDATMLVKEKSEIEEWLTSKREKDTDWYYWDRYEDAFKSKKLPPALLVRTNKLTKKILGKLGDPEGDYPFSVKGMIIGDVQAGKTNNFSALINKAADAGYRLVIVLAGTIEDLRSQTQERLDEDFVGRVADSVIRKSKTGETSVTGVGQSARISRDGKKNAIVLTTQKSDFDLDGMYDLADFRSPALIVAKKNYQVLGKILKWIEGQAESQGVNQLKEPVLIIDDESDNASVNTADENESPKTINRLIRSIINACNKVSYVAYTATPFANIFIDPDIGDDLYPEDFIMTLRPPTNYRGAVYFYDSDDAIKYGAVNSINMDEAEKLLPIKHTKKNTFGGASTDLKDAIGVFLLASAVKDIRRMNGLEIKPFDSMLIHMSRLQAISDQVETPVQLKLDEYMEAIDTAILLRDAESDSAVIRKLKSLWEQHYPHVSEEWGDVKKALSEMNKPEVLVIHGESDDQLNYKVPKADKNNRSFNRKYIVIGGNKLSRGITLEGLVVSYFYRNTQMADSMLQMGRWFGYRDHYHDLLKVWLTPKSRRWYGQITSASEDLREQVTEMVQRGLSPRDFGLKVKKYPESWLITAKNKMRSANRVNLKVGFSDQHLQTYCLFDDDSVIKKNFNVFEEFLSAIDGYRYHGSDIPERHNRHQNYRDVPATEVKKVLKDLVLHPECGEWARDNLFLNYLTENQSGSLKDWDVSVFLKKNTSNTWQGEKFQFNTSDRSIADEVEEVNGVKGVSITRRANISEISFEELGMTKEQYESALQHSKEKQDKKGMTRVAARLYRTKPNLVFFVANVLKNDVPYKNMLCWTISIPPNENEEQAEVWANKDFMLARGFDLDDGDED